MDRESALNLMKSMMHLQEEHRLELAQAIGAFSIEFASMEGTLDLLIHELLGLEPDTGHALTSAIMSVSVRLEILDTLGREAAAAEPWRSEIAAAVSEAIRLNGFRNWLLHDRWAGASKSENEPWKHQKRRMRKNKKQREWQFGSFTTDEIAQFTRECSDVARSVLPAMGALSRLRVERKQKLEQPD